MAWIAALPWYDLPGLRPGIDALWSLLRRELMMRGVMDAPPMLDRSTPIAATWRSPRLLISQACGLDLAFEPQLHVLASPHFDLPDCEPGHYFSWLVARPGAPRHAPRAAINSLRSHSGCSMLRARWPASGEYLTGSHLASLAALRARRADVAAIDALTWRLVETTHPELLDGLEIVGRSASHPAPPWVTTATGEQQRTVRDALLACLADNASAAARNRLGLRGAIRLPAGAYRHLADLQRRSPSGDDPRRPGATAS